MLGAERRGHPSAVGLIHEQHALRFKVKAAERSPTPGGLGLDVDPGYALSGLAMAKPQL